MFLIIIACIYNFSLSASSEPILNIQEQQPVFLSKKYKRPLPSYDSITSLNDDQNSELTSNYYVSMTSQTQPKIYYYENPSDLQIQVNENPAAQCKKLICTVLAGSAILTFIGFLMFNYH